MKLTIDGAVAELSRKSKSIRAAGYESRADLFDTVLTELARLRSLEQQLAKAGLRWDGHELRWISTVGVTAACPGGVVAKGEGDES